MNSNFPTIEKLLRYEAITQVDDFVTLPLGDFTTLELYLHQSNEVLRQIEELIGFESNAPFIDFESIKNALTKISLDVKQIEDSSLDNLMDQEIDKYLPKAEETPMQYLPEEFVQSDENFGFAITEENWKKIPTLLKEEFAENFPFSVFGNTPFHIKNGCYLVSEDQLKLIFSAL